MTDIERPSEHPSQRGCWETIGFGASKNSSTLLPEFPVTTVESRESSRLYGYVKGGLSPKLISVEYLSKSRG